MSTRNSGLTRSGRRRQLTGQLAVHLQVNLCSSAGEVSVIASFAGIDLTVSCSFKGNLCFPEGRVSVTDPVFFPGSGSSFKISLYWDPDPVSAPGSRSKKECRKGSKL